jgi:hypothetical protein
MCGLVQAQGGQWVGVEVGLCELNIARLDYASASGLCDGRIEAALSAVFGLDAVGGVIDAPLPVALDDIDEPSCRPRDATCASNAECCSGACIPALGFCG